ncbi:Carboxylic ester hydrolase [Mycena venus]|uniref:Carboxylic ester hydrolase n=1 Tax=Mycena venus TaxID=2733690 RepID=A0A8H6YM55_9AGAR|nr:Carboxylic ester hydrolase [Mycena venus]
MLWSVKVVLLLCTLSLSVAVSSQHHYHTDWDTKCLSLRRNLQDLENTTILNTTYIAAPQNITTPGICRSTAPVTSAPLCRVEFVINTTSSSVVHAEAWLPDTWYGRFLVAGDGGLGGCIDYQGLDYTTSLHFASVSTDNGHDGGRWHRFWRCATIPEPSGSHQRFRVPRHSRRRSDRKTDCACVLRSGSGQILFSGMLDWRRRGTQAALKFPADFDSIVGGAPATDLNNALGAFGMISLYFGAPTFPPEASPKWIAPDLWPLVTTEILRQCDALDGLVDGIIADPDACEFRPEALQCSGEETASCLTATQASSSTLVSLPAREADPLATATIPGIQPFVLNWFRFAVFNDTEHGFSNFGLVDIELADQINPGGIATFDGDLSTFRNRGGKFLTYHGSHDPLLPATNSKRVYDLIAHTLSLPLFDDFYRLFLIPGMGHCGDGLGANAFGQGIFGFGVDGIAVNASTHNILLALVDWVEGDVAPETIVGTAVDGSTRTHCRYPQRSVWNGTVWTCSGQL